MCWLRVRPRVHAPPAFAGVTCAPAPSCGVGADSELRLVLPGLLTALRLWSYHLDVPTHDRTLCRIISIIRHTAGTRPGPAPNGSTWGATIGHIREDAGMTEEGRLVMEVLDADPAAHLRFWPVRSVGWLFDGNRYRWSPHPTILRQLIRLGSVLPIREEADYTIYRSAIHTDDAAGVHRAENIYRLVGVARGDRR